MIQSVDSFIDYFENIRRRTIQYMRTIPQDRIDWSPSASEFTCAAIIRHLAAAESMFVGVVASGRWRYPGHDHDPADGLDALIGQLETSHIAAMNALRALDDGELNESRPLLKGPQLKAWRVLMAMVEHEVHHRSQLAVYLSQMGVEPPQIFGLGVEEVIALATG
jgi:uncharacterized damage-inducible protein DinB